VRGFPESCGGAILRAVSRAPSVRATERMSVASPSDSLDVDALALQIAGRRILAGISFRAAAGEILAVLGPNGAGKTTLLDCVAGLRAVERGSTRWRGRELQTLRSRAAVMAYMPDEIELPSEASVRIALDVSPQSAAVEALGVGRLLEARGDELSRGESKRVQLAATLARGRPVILLDEPFAAFDPRQLRTLLPIVRTLARDAAVVVTVHQMRTAELLADRMLLLAEGRVLACGTLEELRARIERPAATLDEVFLALLDRAAPDGSGS
jgi:ABC-type multidrug transport system ATPase subunit